MATTLICGFEMQNTGEGGSFISTTVFRSGACSARFHNNLSAAALLRKRLAGGTFQNIFQSCRFYLRIDVLPSANISIIAGPAATNSTTILTLNTTGTLTISDGSSTTPTTSSNALTADSLWHRIDMDVNGTTRTVYVDGVQWAQNTSGGTASPNSTFNYGNGTTTLDIYFDDLALDDASIGAPAAGANNIVILLKPTAGTNAGSWTAGAGGTGDIHAAVASIPPVGLSVETNTSQIKNLASGTALDYVATMQSYTVGGVPAGATINAVMAICEDGEEVATGTKSGGIWIASNPTQSAVVVGAGVGFDYGDDVGALGTSPTGWATHRGIVAVAPTVTLGTAPTMTVRKGSSTTREADVDFMGIYVDYTPAAVSTFIAAKPLIIDQAVNRASTY